MDKNKYTDVELGERFRDLRKTAKLTQEELANKLGITRSAVNGWEMGQAMPSIQYLIQLSKFYHVSVDYLLGLRDDETINISGLNEEDRQIIFSLIDRLNKPVKEKTKINQTFQISQNKNNLK